MSLNHQKQTLFGEGVVEIKDSKSKNHCRTCGERIQYTFNGKKACTNPECKDVGVLLLNKQKNKKAIGDEVFKDADKITLNGVELQKAGQVTDPLNPLHYQRGKIQVRDFITDQGLGYNEGCIIKYLCRAGFKDGNTKLQDLQKALNYLNYLIDKEKEQGSK